MLQSRSEELETRRADIAHLDDALERLRRWLRAMEEYFSGLPEPLMAAARALEPENLLRVPCEKIIATTEEYVRAAQVTGQVRATVTGNDFFLLAVSVAWTVGTAEADREVLGHLLTLIENGYRTQDNQR
ncbi:SbtR family transcriptional regulator [Nocardia gipuzkoensis]